jgi:hypothetical protein
LIQAETQLPRRPDFCEVDGGLIAGGLGGGGGGCSFGSSGFSGSGFAAGDFFTGANDGIERGPFFFILSPVVAPWEKLRPHGARRTLCHALHAQPGRSFAIAGQPPWRPA